jgi:polyisoprenoid-binding protein YceI
MKNTFLLLSALALSGATFAQTWSVDKAHSQLNFGISHLSISEIDGSFRSFDSKITASKEDFSDAVIELTAETGSVNTGNDQRDAHLKTPDFFDAAKYPAFSFKSKSFTKVKGKQYKLAGDLTFHGVTKPVVLDVVLNGTTTNPQSKKLVAGFHITGVIKRSDFGVATGMPTAMLGDEVTLIANTEFTKD